jgi:hypothetical protein
VFFYRPSFGRGGRSKACLGEFDAILVTPLTMYLIETKWDSSPELRGGELAKRQSVRHESITWLAENWEDDEPFSTFFDKNRLKFSKLFPGKELAPEDTGVYQRIEYIFETARKMSLNKKIQVKNIILLMLKNGSSLQFGALPGFSVIEIHYVPLGDSNFFLMD